MRALVATLLLGLALLAGGCRADAVDIMGRTTRAVDQQYSVAYGKAWRRCLADSESRPEYEACLSPWESGREALDGLWYATKALDVAETRHGFKDAACRWFMHLAVVDAVSPIDLSAAKAGLGSKWRKKC